LEPNKSLHKKHKLIQRLISTLRGSQHLVRNYAAAQLTGTRMAKQEKLFGAEDDAQHVVTRERKINGN